MPTAWRLVECQDCSRQVAVREDNSTSYVLCDHCVDNLRRPVDRSGYYRCEDLTYCHEDDEWYYDEGNMPSSSSDTGLGYQGCSFIRSQPDYECAIGIEYECIMENLSASEKKEYAGTYAGVEVAVSGDGSLGDEGAEFQFAPSDPNTQCLAVKALIEAIEDETEITDSCGMHVNISFAKNEALPCDGDSELIFEVAIKTHEMLNLIPNGFIIQLFGREFNNYAASEWRRYDRYSAVNTGNYNRFEFRLPRPSLNVEKTMARICNSVALLELNRFQFMQRQHATDTLLDLPLIGDYRLLEFIKNAQLIDVLADMECYSTLWNEYQNAHAALFPHVQPNQLQLGVA